MSDGQFADPSDLTPEAMKTASDFLAERVKNLPPSTATKRRGRPPTKNKTADGFTLPGTPEKEKATKEKELTLEQKARERAKRADEYSKLLVEELNEKIMSVLMAMGAPAAMLYTEGNIPKVYQGQQKYTEIGNKIAISPEMADAWGKFIADLSMTDQGQKVASVTKGDGPWLMVFHGLMALVMGVQYAKGVGEVMTRLNQIREAQVRAQQQIDQQIQEGIINGGLA